MAKKRQRELHGQQEADKSNAADTFLKKIGEEMKPELTFSPKIVVPGDDVTQDVTQFGRRIRIGQGLIQKAETVIATKGGVLRFKSPNRFWIENNQKRYIPLVGDNVIGVVQARFGERYRLNINGSTTATLPLLAFEGASKRNRPNLQVGALVYARVAVSNQFMEPELSCIALSGVRKDWMTGQSIYGELHGGYTFPCSQAVARSLLKPGSPVLEAVGKVIPFEIAVGQNGRVWLHADTPAHIITITTVINSSQGVPEKLVPRVVQRLLDSAAAGEEESQA